MFLSAILRKISQWQRARRSMRELKGLSDRELDDIGVARRDVGRLARGSGRG